MLITVLAVASIGGSAVPVGLIATGVIPTSLAVAFGMAGQVLALGAAAVAGYVHGSVRQRRRSESTDVALPRCMGGTHLADRSNAARSVDRSGRTTERRKALQALVADAEELGLYDVPAEVYQDAVRAARREIAEEKRR